jgi:hypothetical protein
MPEAVCLAMGRRAHEVEKLGEFIVFFEWLVWAHLRKASVLIQMGENVVRVLDVFGCALPAFEPVAIHRVVAVRTSPKGWLSADVPGSPGSFDANHFVIALPIEGRPSPVCRKVLTKHNFDFRRTAREEALIAGWSLKATDDCGDCGIDAMSYHAGEKRCSPTWRGIRKELSRFMISVQTCPHWQQAFVCCQEFAGEPAEVAPKTAKQSTTSKLSKQKAAAATSPSSPGWVCVTPPRKVTLATSFTSSPLASPASPLLKDAATCLMPMPIGPPISLEPLAPPGKAALALLELTPAVSSKPIDCGDGAPPAKDCSAGIEAASAEATGRGEKRDRDAQQPVSFVAWLQMQTAGEQARVTHSVQTFKDAEAEWSREHLQTRKKPCLDSSPRRAHAATLLRYRVAVGIAYVKWREEEGLL